MNEENKMTIKQLQDYIKSIDYYPMFKRDYLVRLEGEVAALINEVYDADSHHGANPNPEGVAEDIGRIIHSVLAIANLYGVDAETVIFKNGTYSE